MSPPFSHIASLILLYGHLPSYQRPRVSSISQDLRLVLLAHTQNGWGKVAKAEEYGPVRCRMLYCNTDSLSPVLFPHCDHSSFQGHLWHAEQELVLGHFLRPSSTLMVRPRPCISSAQALGLNMKWAGVTNFLASQQPLKILLSDLLVGEQGFGDVTSLLRSVQIYPSSMRVSLHLSRKHAGLRDIPLNSITMRSAVSLFDTRL